MPDIDLDWLSLENTFRKAAAKEWHQRGKYWAEKRLRSWISQLLETVDCDRAELWHYQSRAEVAELTELRRIADTLQSLQMVLDPRKQYSAREQAARITRPAKGQAWKEFSVG